MHHAHREQHSHVAEIINPGNAATSPADIDKYVLRGRPGEFVMEVSFHGKPPDWWITCDIDLVRRRIDVRRAHADVGGHIVLGTPKSHQTRTVPIPGPRQRT
jgi:hypothetical protein